MLEYFTYKKIKKHKARKDATNEAKRLAGSPGNSTPSLDERPGKQREAHGKQRRGDDDAGPSAPPPVLRPDDESFLEGLLAGDDGSASRPPPQTQAAKLDWPSDDDAASASEAGGKDGTAAPSKAGKAADKTAPPGRLALLFTRYRKTEEGLRPQGVPAEEGQRESRDLGRVLERLNLSARNNKAVSADPSQLLGRFAQVFRDLVNGVPTAVDDLTRLVEDRDGAIARGFDKLPSSLKKLVTQLPEKVTGSLAPEILAAAAGSQGIKTDAQGGVKGVAKRVLVPHNFAELVTKPGAVVGMLKAIVEVLKTRWPAFLGMNVMWSVALSLLLFVLWYCHKRGREERLERERAAAAIDGGARVEELPDDPTLPAPEPRAAEGDPARPPSSPRLLKARSAQRRETS